MGAVPEAGKLVDRIVKEQPLLQRKPAMSAFIGRPTLVEEEHECARHTYVEKSESGLL